MTASARPAAKAATRSAPCAAAPLRRGAGAGRAAASRRRRPRARRRAAPAGSNVQRYRRLAVTLRNCRAAMLVCLTVLVARIGPRCRRARPIAPVAGGAAAVRRCREPELAAAPCARPAGALVALPGPAAPLRGAAPAVRTALPGMPRPRARVRRPGRRSPTRAPARRLVAALKARGATPAARVHGGRDRRARAGGVAARGALVPGAGSSAPRPRATASTRPRAIAAALRAPAGLAGGDLLARAGPSGAAGRAWAAAERLANARGSVRLRRARVPPGGARSWWTTSTRPARPSTPARARCSAPARTRRWPYFARTARKPPDEAS